MRRKRYFQWIGGELMGDIEVLTSIEDFDGELIYHFESGESCNQNFISKMTNSTVDLKQKFMVEIDSPMNPWTTETVQPKKYIDESMKGEDINIPSLHDILNAHGNESSINNSDIGSLKLVPPKTTQSMIPLPTIEEYPIKQKEVPQKIDPQVKQEIQKVIQEETQEKQIEEKKEQKNISFNPIRILVDSCKKHETKIDLTLNMELPSKYIANIAMNEFDDGFEKFLDCVVSDIDVKIIIDSLRLALKESYESNITQE